MNDLNFNNDEIQNFTYLFNIGRKTSNPNFIEGGGRCL